jgi:ABC-type proline/glycine betaine transport system ATPase subunit
MQRRFSREFKRHVLTRKNLIIQILFLFLNFAVFWLPAEMIMFYPKNSHLKDALQVTKSLNILLDPLIIAIYDTRFKAAAKQLIAICPFNEFVRTFITNRQHDSSILTQSTIRYLERSRQMTRNITGNNDDITAIELVPNHSPQRQRTERQQQHFTSSVIHHQSIDSRQRSTQTKRKIADIHV